MLHRMIMVTRRRIRKIFDNTLLILQGLVSVFCRSRTRRRRVLKSSSLLLYSLIFIVMSRPRMDGVFIRVVLLLMKCYFDWITLFLGMK